MDLLFIYLLLYLFINLVIHLFIPVFIHLFIYGSFNGPFIFSEYMKVYFYFRLVKR